MSREAGGKLEEQKQLQTRLFSNGRRCSKRSISGGAYLLYVYRTEVAGGKAHTMQRACAVL